MNALLNNLTCAALMCAVFAFSFGLGLFLSNRAGRTKIKNRLQKKAWKDLAIGIFWAIAMFFYFIPLLVKTNAGGIIFVIFAVLIGIWCAVGQLIQKKRILRGMDEREKFLYERAKMVSESIFGGLFISCLFGLTFWIGAKEQVDISVVLYTFFAVMLVAHISQSLIILIQCKMEQGDAD
jgi:hypothetical protein